MPDVTMYGRPEWHIGFTGFEAGDTGNYPSPQSDSSMPNRVQLYIKAFKLHLYGGDVGGSWGSETEYIHLYPPERSEVISEMRSKYGSTRLAVGDSWSGSRYYPRDGDNDTVWGWTSGSPWNYSTSSTYYLNWTTSSLHFNAYIHAHTSDVSSDHTGSNRGSFSSANFTWTAGSGTSDKDPGEWEDELRLVEADIVSAVAVNGRYPEYPATTATFGTYTAATNTYVAGADQALNADDWYIEFGQAVTALQAAITRIGTLRTDLDGAATVRDPEAEEDEFPEGSGPTPDFSWREQDLGDEELIEFPEIEFQLPEDPPPPPKQDAVEVPGLIRLARFAKPTDNVAAFSESTHSEPSFTPRESISPEFNKEDE